MIAELAPQPLEQQIIDLCDAHPFRLRGTESGFSYVIKESEEETTEELEAYGIRKLGRGNSKAIYALPNNDSIVMALQFKPIDLHTFHLLYASNLIMESLSPHVPHMYGNPIMNSNDAVIGFYKQKIIGSSDPVTQKYIGNSIREVNRLRKLGLDPVKVNPGLEIYTSASDLFNIAEEYGFSIFMDDGVELQWMLRYDGVPFYVDEFWTHYGDRAYDKYMGKPKIDKIFEDINRRVNSKENFEKLLLGWQILFSLRS